jgi:hypothetical protein
MAGDDTAQNKVFSLTVSSVKCAALFLSDVLFVYLFVCVLRLYLCSRAAIWLLSQNVTSKNCIHYYSIRALFLQSFIVYTPTHNKL